MSQSNEERISQLESQVSNLTALVADLQVDLKAARKTLRKTLRLIGKHNRKSSIVQNARLQNGEE